MDSHNMYSNNKKSLTYQNYSSSCYQLSSIFFSFFFPLYFYITTQIAHHPSWLIFKKKKKINHATWFCFFLLFFSLHYASTFFFLIRLLHKRFLISVFFHKKTKIMLHVASPHFKLKNIVKHDWKKKSCGMVDCHMSIFFLKK